MGRYTKRSKSLRKYVECFKWKVDVTMNGEDIRNSRVTKTVYGLTNVFVASLYTYVFVCAYLCTYETNKFHRHYG